jgi:tripartite-type tricarboxylate transporter receptor subunit TctC
MPALKLDMLTRRSVARRLGLMLAAVAAAPVASAATYPTHRVKIITTVAAGGTVDVLARLIAEKLSESLGQSFYVEDMPGGGGKMGAAAAARSAPDGYTLLFVFNSFITDISLYSEVPYDPIKDFAPVTLVATSPYVLVVPPSLGVRSVQELLTLVKGNPGKYSYAAPGNLVDEMFRLANGLNMVRVPFNSAPPAIASTIGGFTQMAFTSIGAAVPNINAGKLLALAVTSHKRLVALPQVPTLTEAGVPEAEASFMQGVVVPAATPKEIIGRLQSEIARIVALPDIVGKLTALGLEPVANKPEQFGAYIKSEIARWGDIIRRSNLKVE